MALLSLLLTVGLALIHPFVGKMPLHRIMPRSHWLSLAGGVSIAFTFVFLLPELSSRQRDVQTSDHPIIVYLEHHVYLMALAGLIAFYALEHVAQRTREREDGPGAYAHAKHRVFWLHILAFAGYNAVIGYLLLRRSEHGPGAALPLFLAMALHFMANDLSLREHYEEDYNRIGRWALAPGVLIGWVIAWVAVIPQATLALLFAFLAGGIILNALKEELPGERESHIGIFTLAAAIYAVMLVIF
jgi:zinc transporter ZupT